MACIVLTYPKQSDLYQNRTQLLQLLCQVTLDYPHQGSFSEVEQRDLLFIYFVSIFQLTLRFNLRDVDGRPAWERYLDAFFPGCLQKGGV